MNFACSSRENTSGVVMGKMHVSVLAILAMSLSSVALADPPPWAGSGKGKGKGHAHQRDRDSRADHPRHFADNQRIVVHEYYGEEFQRGKCPPGLRKKNNGCMPPGQAKKWRMGRPLPHDLVYYPVPQPLIVKLGPPPPGHRYVRVAGDILLITIGTAIVVDAIQDLGRMG
jgi:Ni/Co efflux regulator RcnB